MPRHRRLTRPISASPPARPSNSPWLISSGHGVSTRPPLLDTLAVRSVRPMPPASSPSRRPWRLPTTAVDSSQS